MKFFIIRLKDNEISEKYSKECISQAKLFNIDLETFDGINGNEYQTHLDKLKINPRYKFKKGRVGVFGCFLSHYYLWKSCADSNSVYCILEHDGYIIKPIDNNWLNEFDDVLKLDNLDPYSKSYNKVLEQQAKDNVVIRPYVNPEPKFLEKNQTGNYMKGAYGYMIKPSGAKKLLTWISKNGFVPADQQIGDAIVNIKVTNPTVIRLHPDYHKRIGSLSLTANPELI